MEYTKEEWEEILQDSGLHKNSARLIAGNVRERIKQREKQREEGVLESKDITEPLDAYKK